jgi:hypothetical protein
VLLKAALLASLFAFNKCSAMPGCLIWQLWYNFSPQPQHSAINLTSQTRYSKGEYRRAEGRKDLCGAF